MCKSVLPPAWRHAWAEFNREYLTDRTGRRELLWNLAAAVVIFGGLYFGAWIMAPLP